MRLSLRGIGFAVALASACLLHCALARAAVGLVEVQGRAGDGPLTVYYPSSDPAHPLKRGPFTLQVAWQGKAQPGNGRLVLISHGSGGSPWTHSKLAGALVEAGFVVAMPEHRENNYKDDASPGPPSWKQRPAEMSRAIDTLAAEPRFAPLLRLDKVGAYGMSAGGHTALTLAGGRWSMAQLKRHCEAHIADDFQACAGLSTRLTGGALDATKKTVALFIIRQKLDDEQWHSHTDARIAAVVAGVPFAADFDPASLANPAAPLALITAQQDIWLVPRFHSAAVLKACAACELLADFPTGGHGALLSPLPPGETGLLGELINDPPDFDRAETTVVDQRVVAYFSQHLLP